MYIVTDRFDYSCPPEWKFQRSDRNTFNTKPKYDYYGREDTIVRPPHAERPPEV